MSWSPSVGVGRAPWDLPGAQAPTRYVGGTASGAPIAGTFEAGDFVIDETGFVWICTAAGSPGTWVSGQASGGVSNADATAIASGTGGVSGDTTITTNGIVRERLGFDGSGFLLPITFAPPPSGGDDTAALQSAIAGAAGSLLVLATGVYEIQPDSITIPDGMMVVGQGQGDVITGLAAATKIVCNGPGKALTFAGDGSSARDFAVVYGGVSTPVDGTVGIYGNSFNNGRLYDVTVSGFFNNFHFENGRRWQMRGCISYAFFNYGILIRDTALPDGGDMLVDGNQIYAAVQNSASAVRWESGGGCRIVNNKINGAGGFMSNVGVDVAIGAGLSTGDVFVRENSIENVAVYGVSVSQADGATGTVEFLDITGNEVLLIGAGVLAGVRVTTAASAAINNGVIGTNTLRGPSLPSLPAVSLSTTSSWIVLPQKVTGFGSAVGTDAACTNVRNMNARLGFTQFPSGDKSTSSTSFVDLSGTTVAVRATPGDMIRLVIRGAIYCTTANAIAATLTWVDGVLGTEISSSAEWLVKTQSVANDESTVAYEFVWIATAARLSGGVATLSPQWKISDGTKTVVFRNSGGAHAFMSAENLGPNVVV